MKLVDVAFRRFLEYHVRCWLPGRTALEQAFFSSRLYSEVDDRILVLDQYCPWSVPEEDAAVCVSRLAT